MGAGTLSACCADCPFTALLKSHNQGSEDWLDHKSLTSCIKRKIAKIPILLKCTVTLQVCQPPTIIPFHRFSWPCPCWQTAGMVLHWLQNIRIWLSGPACRTSGTSHQIDSWQQPEPRLLPTSLCLKHPSAVFRANCFSSCKTQLNCPLLQETNYFFHWVYTAHYHGSQCLHTCLGPSFTKSPWGCTF